MCPVAHSDSPAGSPTVRRLKSAASPNPIRKDLGLVRSLKWAFCTAARLLYFVGGPGLWLLQLLRLVLFVAFTLPALLPEFVKYLANPSIRKNIVYGPSLRHQLDVYIPGEGRGDAQRPLVIFLSGGAWCIGYKVWPFLQCKVLQANGVVCVSPDYRNFPQSNLQGMVDDVDAALAWVFAHMDELGADPRNVTLMGQSAGAHLGAMLLIQKALREAHEAHGPSAMCAEGTCALDRYGVPAASPPADDSKHRRTWRVSEVRTFVSISGPFALGPLMEDLHRRGLHRRLLSTLMSEPARFSPTELVPRMGADRRLGVPALRRLPPFHLIHGDADKTCHWHQTRDFGRALSAAGVVVNVDIWEGKTHTDPILEDPMSGHDEMMHQLLGDIWSSGRRGGREGASKSFADDINGDAYLLPRLLPDWLVELARASNPF